MNINSTLYLSQLGQSENSFESKLKQALKDEYKHERPSRNVLNTILAFAASYDCVDTQVGKVELIFN